MHEDLHLITNQHFVESIQQSRFGRTVHALAAHQKLLFNQTFSLDHVPSARVPFQNQFGLQLNGANNQSVSKFHRFEK